MVPPALDDHVAAPPPRPEWPEPDPPSLDDVWALLAANGAEAIFAAYIAAALHHYEAASTPEQREFALTVWPWLSTLSEEECEAVRERRVETLSAEGEWVRPPREVAEFIEDVQNWPLFRPSSVFGRMPSPRPRSPRRRRVVSRAHRRRGPPSRRAEEPPTFT
jgi:hypothetical protein